MHYSKLNLFIIMIIYNIHFIYTEISGDGSNGKITNFHILK